MLRPQPIGIFPFPANYLLLNESFNDSEAYQNLMRGQLPKEESFYKFALENDIENALESLVNDESNEATFNRFVLQSSPEFYRELKTEFSDEFAVLLDVAAFTLNYVAEPPSAENTDGEIRALVLSAQATYKLENREIDEAIKLLQEAKDSAKAVSPIFSAQIAGNLAETKHQSFGASADVVMLYKQAIEGLKNSELGATKAVLNLNLGICYQEMSQGNRGALLEAVKHYQESLKYFSREDFPEEFAFTQNNLALAYLSIPLTEASDTLRVAIAIQALREALKVYTKSTHPELWASTQLNLANALQHAPSGHVEENLMEAVNLYEEILSVRQPTENPVGFARLLANQGNALAHLGVFEHAIPKLNEAKNIFAQIGESDSAEAIAEVLNEIETQRSGQLSVAGGQ